jgi:hypothetical protein
MLIGREVEARHIPALLRELAGPNTYILQCAGTRRGVVHASGTLGERNAPGLAKWAGTAGDAVTQGCKGAARGNGASLRTRGAIYC